MKEEFKVLRGEKANLPVSGKSDYYIYHTTDTHQTYIGDTELLSQVAIINDSAQTSADSYYALTSIAKDEDGKPISGKTVISDDKGFPIWGDEILMNKLSAGTNIELDISGDTITISSKGGETAIINGLEQKSGQTYFAPTELGNDNDVLITSGSGVTWVELETKEFSAGTNVTIEESGNTIIISALGGETAIINGLEQKSGQTYFAPTELGNDNDVLITSGSGVTWTELVVKELSAGTNIELDLSGDTIIISSLGGETAIINGLKQTSAQTYFALTSSATTSETRTTVSGQTVVSDENGLPVWGEVVKAKKLSAGTNVELDLSGDTITISAKGGDESARINDLVQTSAQTYYAPTEWGTSGQVLTSKGEDNAPEWQDHIMIVPITNADYSALTEDEKNDEFKVYAITDSDGTGVGDDGLIMLNDTPLANHAEDSFYAPTTKPTLDGQVAVSSSSSSVPVWSTLLDMIYPVGSIYITVSNSLPSFFTANGEEWEKVAEGNSLWTVSDAELGTSLSGSLPSITGSIATMFAKGDEPVTSQGALSGENNIKSWKSGTNNELWRTTLTLNAAKSSAVYSGTDDTVRPTSLGVSMWIRKS